MSQIGERTLVVIPCYNEARRLEGSAFLAELEREPLLEFIFVDDGSQDQTLDVLATIRAAGGERIHLVSLAKNAGKAEAVRQGVLRAFAEGAALIGYWDADLATPLEAIGTFASVLRDKNLSFALGSRVKLLGRHIERDARRHYLGRVFATVAAVSLGVAVYDTQCGAKLFRATPALKLAFGSAFRQRWTFDVELFGRLIDQGIVQQCVEVPLQQWCEKPGSKLRLTHAPRILWEISTEVVLRRGLGRWLRSLR